MSTRTEGAEILTMDACCIPGVNSPGNYVRRAFSECTEVYQIESDFEAGVKGEFDKMIRNVVVEKAE